MAQSQPADPPYDQQMVSLSRVLKAVRAAPAAADAITLALTHFYQELDFDVAWVGLYDRERHRLITHGYHSPPQMRPMRTAINLTPGDLMEQAVIQQRPLIVADLQNEVRAGEWGVIAKQFALQSAILYPIKRQEICFGLLVLASPRWGLTSSLAERSYLAIVMGALAEVLYHFDAEQQRQQAKRLEQPLLALLGRLGLLPDVDSQLKEVVRETQRFIGPTRTRVFWFEPKGNYFWQRQPSPSSLSFAQPEEHVLQLPVDEVRGLYQALCNQQLVVLGESRGALNTIVSDRLMQQLQAQSLMVAPLTAGTDLIGFLSVEGSLPRLWQEPEKQFLMGMARLLSLALPTATRQEDLRHTQIEQYLTAGVIQGIHSDRDWRHALQTCFTNLGDRLGIQQFFVLLFNADRNGYDLCFHGQASRGATPLPLWPGLDDVDWQLLERSPAPVAIDNLPQDLKLMAWRPHLLELGAQAVMVSNVSPGHQPEGIVVVSDRINRQWTAAEQALFLAVGRQIGVILHQWQLQRQIEQQQDTYEAINWGLQALHQGLRASQLEQTTLEHILPLLQGSLALLVTWTPGAAQAQISQVVCQDTSVWVKEDHAITLATDALVQEALQSSEPLTIPTDQLPSGTKAWLAPPLNSRLLVTALRTAPSHLVTGVMVLVASTQPPWTSHQLTLFRLLTNQLAWSRRHLHLANLLTQQRQDLEHLNWYKHHWLEKTHWDFNKLAQEFDLVQARGESLSPVQSRYFLSRLKNLVEDTQVVLDQERWQLQRQTQTMPLISLLNRLIERITPVLESRQLWSKVHNDSNVVVSGDMAKLELILYDVLLAACQRSPIGGRIDIWCRVLNLDWLELSITDNGHCPPALLEELKVGGPADILAPSKLDEAPGLHLAICQTLLEQLGGEITFSVLEDGRTHSRLLLPLAAKGELASS
ncbi:MAG: GAF domain-containing protein [Leptolyngbyaceae cyanobacterium SM2_5_2]|nr:GAF domain-containing protein [Leptolyngbyaceae cyanobacterium SM2_5_2]